MARMHLLNSAENNIVEGFCLVRSAQVRVNAKGSDYLDLVLGDAGGDIIAKLWDYTPTTHGVYDADEVIKVKGSLHLWKDTEQLKIDKIRHAAPEDGVDMAALVPCAPLDPAWVYEELFARTEAFEDEDLKRITQYLLRAHKARLLTAPAAVKLHHATRGGLLHHTYSIVCAAEALCPLYPALSKDLVLAGAMLHDIAKLDEMEIGALGLAGGYTLAGQLIGHIGLGTHAVFAAGEMLDIPEELTQLLAHMVLSHHGQAEFGSPRMPMFPEAELLAELDMLDSRLYEMLDALASVPIGGFSERVWALDNRQLYQHGRNKKQP